MFVVFFLIVWGEFGFLEEKNPLCAFLTQNIHPNIGMYIESVLESGLYKFHRNLKQT